MRLDPTIALVITLLTLMLGATATSAFWGYSLGRKALGGITQPDTRPNQLNVTSSQTSHSSETQNDHHDIVLKSEDEILQRVKARMNGEEPTAEAEQTPESEAQASTAATKGAETEGVEQAIATTAETSSDVSFVNYQSSFPLLTEDNNVILAINSVQQQGATLRVDVSLQNVGGAPVEFLYSLMDVSDNQGQVLSASTEGLPQAIPPTGETFNGAVVIPMVLLDRSDSFSLRLTDYPDQQVELAVSDIPIVR